MGRKACLNLRASIFLFITATTGCMVGPDYQRPVTPAEKIDDFAYAVTIQDVNDTIGPWWEGFADTATDQLVRKAIKNNYDLKAAVARTFQSYAILNQAEGARLPQINYNLNASRDRFSFVIGDQRIISEATTWNHGINVSYVLDIFGRLRRAERAAWGDFFATQANQKAVLHGIISNVVLARINVATLQTLLEIAQSNVENWEQTLNVIESRYESGLVSPLDVRLARENLADTRSQERAVKLSLIEAQNALAILLGISPIELEELTGTLADLPDLELVPVGIPAKLLDRRPDVIAAEYNLRAASERIGVSIARLYPDLNLTGSYGRTAESFGDIWQNGETRVYSAVMNLAQPIFQGGQIRAQINQSKARFSELAANYAQIVLQAIREVEDALATEQLLLEQLTFARQRYEEALAAEELARDRYGKGLENVITVLETERRRRLAENELNTMKGRIWTARVNLYLALGGDWIDSCTETVDEEQEIDRTE